MNSTLIAPPLDSTLAQSAPRHVGQWISVFMLAMADAVAFVLAYLIFRIDRPVPALALVLRSPTQTLMPVDVLLVLAAIFILVRYLSGDYLRRLLFWDGAKFTTIAILITSLPDLLMMMLGGAMYAKLPVVLSWVFLLVAVPLLRQLARLLMSKTEVWQIPTAIVGVGPRTVEIANALGDSLSLGFDLRWLMVDNPEKRVPPELRNLAVVHAGEGAHAARALFKSGCKQAIVLTDDPPSSHFADIVQQLLEANVQVAIIPSLNRLPLAHATTNYFFGRDILMLQMRSNVQRRPWRLIKRSFDVVVSAVTMILLLPFFLLIAAAIKLDSAGPVTYSQTRVGRRGIQFRCHKFRTMGTNADEVLERWKTDNPSLHAEFLETFKLRNDPRITRFGKWLRKTSLDELPQIWNVLRGEMSLVGPRPIPEQQLHAQYGNAAELYLRVRPGMSGLWQISGRSETTADQRVILDEWYILNWSFWYDIVILIQTAWIVLTGKGAY